MKNVYVSYVIIIFIIGLKINAIHIMNVFPSYGRKVLLFSLEILYIICLDN